YIYIGNLCSVAGRKISILWPPNPTVHFRSNSGTRSPRHTLPRTARLGLSSSRLPANQPENDPQNFSRPTIAVDLRNYQILVGRFIRRSTLASTATRPPLHAPATSSGAFGADGVRSRQVAAMRREETAAACCLPPSTRRHGTSDTAARGSGGSILCSSIKSLVGKQDPDGRMRIEVPCFAAIEAARFWAP
ncbi:unnamed protein product, partial [Urochloa humidicola]